MGTVAWEEHFPDVSAYSSWSAVTRTSKGTFQRFHTSTEGNDANGCAEFEVTGRKSQWGLGFYIEGAWTDFGVPGAATVVDDVRVDRWADKNNTWTTGDTVQPNGWTLRNTSDGSLATLHSGRADVTSGPESSWTENGPGTDQTVPATHDDPTDTVRLCYDLDILCGNSSSAIIQWQLDDAEFTITYTVPYISEACRMGSIGIQRTVSIRITAGEAILTGEGIAGIPATYTSKGAILTGEGRLAQGGVTKGLRYWSRAPIAPMPLVHDPGHALWQLGNYPAIWGVGGGPAHPEMPIAPLASVTRDATVGMDYWWRGAPWVMASHMIEDPPARKRRKVELLGRTRTPISNMNLIKLYER